MTARDKIILRLVVAWCAIATTLSVSHFALATSETHKSGAEASVFGQAYVQGPRGEELLTIDWATGAVVSRSSLGAHPESSAGGTLPKPGLRVARAASASTTVFNKKVYVLVYDPLLSNGKKLSAQLNWNDHAVLTQGTIDFFRQASNNRLNYTVVYTTVVTGGWPEKIDGFQYTEAQYLAVINNQMQPHSPDTVDYVKIINTPAFDICGKVNRGEIDELWIYNGPYFGFYESQLVGPNAYWYNSPPITSGTACNRLLPVMGPSPEVALPNAVHNFGHRAEATMTRVYGSWQQNRTAHNWERFALVDALSPNYSYSGCGNIHFPPNATQDYEYGRSASTNSNCDDFANYPNLSDPATTAHPVACSAWGCNDFRYYDYWFSHLPSTAGCASDGFASDWWKYFADPLLAVDATFPCRVRVFLPFVMR